MDQFFIEEPPEGLDPEVIAYLKRQFLLLQDALQTVLDIDSAGIMPAKTQDGMVRYSDGLAGNEFPEKGLWLYSGEWVKLDGQSPYATCGELPVNDLICGNITKPSIFVEQGDLLYIDAAGKEWVLNIPEYIPPDVPPKFDDCNGFALGNYKSESCHYPNTIGLQGSVFFSYDNANIGRLLTSHDSNNNLIVLDSNGPPEFGVAITRKQDGTGSKRLYYSQAGSNDYILSPRYTWNAGVYGDIPEWYMLTLSAVSTVPASPRNGTFAMYNYGGSFGYRPAVYLNGAWSAIALFEDLPVAAVSLPATQED